MTSLLQNEGYRVTVVTPKIYSDSPYFENQNGIKVYRFPFLAGNKLLIEHETIPYLRMVIYYITGFVFSLYAVLKNRCDLIHVHWAIPTGLIGVVAGWLLRKPMVVTIHGSDLRIAVSGPSVLKRIFVHVCQAARHVHVVSEPMKNVVEGLGISREKISTWPMGVDDVFLQAGENRKANWNGRPITVLSNRNLLPIYDVSCLIRAIPLVLQQAPEVRFLIAGDGPEKESLEKEAERLQVHSAIQFLGRVSHDQMAELLADANIFVSTSLSDGTSVSLLEALTSGAFPVVTDITANREWIRHGENGFLVPVRDEKIMAERIIEAIQNADLREKARKRNLEIVKQRAYWEGNIPKMIEIYKHCLAAG